ncbi:MAG: DUF11 domain-containing protein [Chloroflexi bacterium]|nr:MAG: DUF11 domain-containing protein [Chloroflexota bacterium]
MVPGSTTIVSMTAPAGWTCVSPASGGTGTVTCSFSTLQALAAPQVLTLVVKVNPGTSEGTTITNTAAVTSATIDANPANNSATLTTMVKTPLADLFATTADDPDPVIASKDLTYTLTIVNSGPNGAQDVWVSDQIPAKTTFVSLAQTNGPTFSCSTPAVSGTGTVSCSSSTFASGATATFRLVVNVNANTTAGTLIYDTVTVASSTNDPNPNNNSDTGNTHVKTEADLFITQADDPDPVIAGANLTYTLTIANAGPNGAQGAWVSDQIPANTVFVSLAQTNGTVFNCSAPPVGGTGTASCSAGSLAAGATATFRLVVNVNVNTMDGTLIRDTVTVGSSTNDPNPWNNSDTGKTQVKTEADLSVTKADDPDPVIAGDNLTYTLTIANAGPNGAQSVWVSDQIPGNTTFVSLAQNSGPAFSCSAPPVGGTGTVSCSNSTFAFGATATFRLVVNVNANTTDGTFIRNTVTVGTSTNDPNPGNNSATVKTQVKTEADLSVTKADDPDPVSPGANLAYILTIANAGPNGAQGVWVSDDIPANTTFISLAQNSGPVFNCSTPPVGGTGTVGCSAGSLAAGAMSTFTLVVNVNANTPDGTLICNTVTVGSSTSDPNPDNNSDTEKTEVKTEADLSVTKADDPDPVIAGNDLTYTLIVNNAGPSDAQNVAVSDEIPANSTFVSLAQTNGPVFNCSTPSVGGTGTVGCSAGSLAAGATATFTLVVNVNANTASGTTIKNTVTVASSTSDPCPGNNSDTEKTEVKTAADLSATKADDVDPVTAGNNLTYTLIVNNPGPSDAQTVSISDPIPANTTFVSLAQNGGPPFTCSTPAVGGTGSVTCNIATLAAGATASFALVVKVDANTPDGTVLSNTVTVTSTTTDPVPGNNSATETTKVKNVPAPSADLSVTKADDVDPVTAGNNLTYTLVVNNPGPSDAQSVLVSDPIPANTTFVSLAQNGGPAFTCSTPAVGGTGTVNCSIATLPAGMSVTFTLIVKVDATTADGTVLSNTVTVTSTTTDPVPGNNSATETTKVKNVPAPSADLSVTKADSPDPVAAGANLTYTLTITNAGPSDAQSVSVSDPIPANTTFVSLAQNTGPTFTCSTPAVNGTGTVTCSIATLPAGMSATFTLIVKVDATTADGTVLSNTVTVTSSTADPVPGNNSATATTTVQSVPPA